MFDVAATLTAIFPFHTRRALASRFDTHDDAHADTNMGILEGLYVQETKLNQKPNLHRVTIKTNIETGPIRVERMYVETASSTAHAHIS
jgi:hypothetical protein